LDPKWLGPYTVVHKVSDLVYKIRIGTREVNLNVEQLKLCRATREQLRTRRRERRRMLREQHPRPEASAEFDSSSEGEADSEEALLDPFPHGNCHREGPAEHLGADSSSSSPPREESGGERDHMLPDKDIVSETGEGTQRPSSGGPRYHLRQRLGTNYKE
jgi:hypothetical protein